MSIRFKRKEGGTVTIQTKNENGRVQIVISDDGIGFDPERECQEDGRSHVGLSNVRNRLERMCAGTLAVQSSPGIGTKITITIPKEAE